MRRVVCGLLVCVNVICAAQTASAQSPWYIEGSAGALIRLDASRSTTISNSIGTSGPAISTTTYDPGYVINFGLGYKLPFGVRVEGELGYAHYSASSVSPSSTNGAFPPLNGSRLGLLSGGTFDQGSATANAFYDLPISGRVVPYIGAGFGVLITSEQTWYFAGNGVPKFTQDGRTIVNPAILAEVGLTIALDANWAAVPSYRLVHVFTESGAFPIDENLFKLGLRYSF